MKRNRYEVFTQLPNGKRCGGYAVTRTKYDPVLIPERWTVFDSMIANGEKTRTVRPTQYSGFVYVYQITTVPQVTA